MTNVKFIRIQNKILAWVLFLAILFGSIILTPVTSVGAAEAAVDTGRDIEITLAADAAGNNLSLDGYSDKLKAYLYSNYGIPEDKVHIQTVDSTTYNAAAINWYAFDHTNTSYAANTPTSLISYFNDYSVLNRDRHITFANGGSTIDFYGYGSPAYRDFLFNPDSDTDNKIFTFTMNESAVSYHTLQYGGFLFNAKYTYSSGSRLLSGYVIAVSASTIDLYKLKDVDVTLLTSGNGYGGGSYTLLSSVAKPAAVNGYRYLKVVASPTYVSLYQFTDNTYSASVSGGKLFENYALPETFGAFGFGPYAAYAAHGCQQLTHLSFSDLKIMKDSSNGFADIVRSTNWQYEDSLKLFANVDNDGVIDFGSSDKLSSILYYTMMNNAYYIGWGLNNAINIGGYNTVANQANGFINRNNGKGIYINRSVSSTSTLDQGVAATGDYIASLLRSGTAIEKPTINTTINGTTAICTSPDTTTSNGNPVSEYEWKCLDIASGVWTAAANSTNTNSSNFSTNTYNMVALRIKDSVTGQWSDSSYAYIATVAGVAPVSQFSLDKTTLMPDTSVIGLNTGGVVTASDTSYLPNGGNIAEWEWTCYDKALIQVPSFTKSYTSASIPAAITFDFSSAAAGKYTIILRTKNAGGTWSSNYSQQVTLYKESTAITITTTGSTSSANMYSETTSIPFSISSTGGNISTYRLIKLYSDDTMAIGDWTKADTASVTSSRTISNTNCDAFIQAIDASGNSRTQFVGSYMLKPNLTAVFQGTSTAYSSNTPTNRNVVMTSTDSNIEVSTDNGQSWNVFSSPITAVSSADYLVRYEGDTDSTHYTAMQVNINKNFAGSVSGFENNVKTSSNITPVISNATATLSKDGGSFATFTSGTPVTATGTYSLVLTDIYGNTAAYNFLIDKTVPTINVTGNAVSWTRQDVILSISAASGISGVQSISVIKGDDESSRTSLLGLNTFTIESNGVYTFTVTNEAGVSAGTVITVSKIDKETPAVTISGTENTSGAYQYSSSIPSESDVTISLTDPNDVISGVTYYSSLDGVSWNQMSDTHFQTADTMNETTAYYFKGVSGSGIESTVTAAQYIYIVKPVFSNDISVLKKILDGTNYDGSWTNQDVTITLSNGINAAAFRKYQYSTDPSDSGSWKDMSGEGKNTLTITSDTNTSYAFRVVSLGNSSGQATVSTPVRIDKTVPTDLTVSFDGREFTGPVGDLTLDLSYADKLDISISANSDISGIDHYEYQLIDASLGQVFDINAVWNTYSSLSVSAQFQGAVYARAVDRAGNVSYVVRSDGFSIDIISPTSPTIGAVTDGAAYLGQWVSGDITLTASGSQALSGIAYYEYRTAGSSVWSRMPDASGAEDSISGQPIYDRVVVDYSTAINYDIRGVSNSGIIGAQSSKVVKRDCAVPATTVIVTGKTGNWTNEFVSFDVSNKNDNVLSPVTFWIKIGDTKWTQLTSGKHTFSTQMNEAVSFKSITQAGVEDIDPKIYSVQIDKSIPTLSGADTSGTYYIGRAIILTDLFGATQTYSYTRNGGPALPMVNGELLSEPGTYVVTAIDKAGNGASITFEVKALPAVSDIVYTDPSKNLIAQIREEYLQHKDLPDLYMQQMDTLIKDLEARYASLNTQASEITAKTEGIRALTEKLSPANNGILELKLLIKTEYEKISGTNSVLTPDQKAALEVQRIYLSSLLDIIESLENQEKVISDRVNSIPTTEEGLMAQEEAINEILNDTRKLTQEQQKDLSKSTEMLQGLLNNIAQMKKEQKDIADRILAIPTNANGLLGQASVIAALQKEIMNLTKEQKTVIEEEIEVLNKLYEQKKELAVQINAVEALTQVLSQTDITENDLQNVKDANAMYNALTAEQKAQLSKQAVESLNDATQNLVDQLMTDQENGVFISDTNGNFLSTDMNLVVTRTTEKSDSTVYAFAMSAVTEATGENGVVGDKELAVLYDISLISNGKKIQPNGDIQVTIAIPDVLLVRTGLDIVYIADDGTVTSMHAVRDGGNLIFTTSHFSKYAIIADDTCIFGICKALGIYSPNSGICIDWILIIGILAIPAGIIITLAIIKNNKRRKLIKPVRNNL